MDTEELHGQLRDDSAPVHDRELGLHLDQNADGTWHGTVYSSMLGCEISVDGKRSKWAALEEVQVERHIRESDHRLALALAEVLPDDMVAEIMARRAS